MEVDGEAASDPPVIDLMAVPTPTKPKPSALGTSPGLARAKAASPGAVSTASMSPGGDDDMYVHKDSYRKQIYCRLAALLCPFLLTKFEKLALAH